MRPARRRHQAHDRFHGGRLAGAVAAEQHDAPRPRTTSKRDIGQDVRAAVVGVEALDLQHQCAPKVEPAPR